MISTRSRFAIAIVSLSSICEVTAQKAEIPFGPPGFGLQRVVIDADLPGAYQVEIADVNGDGKPDIVALGGGTVAWYENPNWTKRLVSTPETTPKVISTATRDIDGDGKAEVAIAYEFEMTKPKQGKLLLARQNESGWIYEPKGDFPSIHRLRWGDFDGDDLPDLAVAPIFGEKATAPNFQEQGADLVVLFGGESEKRSEIGRKRVTHAIKVVPSGDQGRDILLSASNEGVWSHRFADSQWISRKLFDGAAGERPKTGSSEIHQGRISASHMFYAVIDPWHGTHVVVRVARSGDASTIEKEEVLDDSLKDGHALCVADIDGDGVDEVFAGFRGPGTSVIGYRLEGSAWKRTVIDTKIAAQDLRAGDVDGDGRADIVSVGGATKNVVLYRTVAPNKK